MTKKKDSCLGEKEYPDDVIEGASLLYFLKYSQDPINIHQEHEAVIKKPRTVIKKPKAVIKKPKAVIKKPSNNNGEQEISKKMTKDYSASLSLKDSSTDPIYKDEENEEIVTQKQHKRRKIVKEEDKREEITCQRRKIVNNGESEILPPDRITSKIPNAVAVKFSRCISKQLTQSDVSVGQSRLLLREKEVKDKFLCLLEESEIPGVEGVDVLVYGPDGESHEMKFKMWNKNMTPVLANGWSQFVKAYELQKCSDVVKIWMFKRSEDGKICFVIDSIRS